MRLPLRHSWQLRRIERGLRRSEPHLAAMLTIFARLSAGEPATGCEQLPGSVGRLRMILTAVAGAVTTMAVVTGRALRAGASRCAAAARLGRPARTPLSPAGAARGGTRPGRPHGQ
jgi:hypothetical protein